MEKIIHVKFKGDLGLLYVGTHCGRFVLVSQTVAHPREATCKVCQKALTEQGKREMCVGCYNDFYNNNNPYNIKTCWSLEKLK